MANYLSIEKRKTIFHLLCEGNGVRGITRLVGCSKSAVSELQRRYCHIIEFINKRYINDLDIEEIEADEIRTFVNNKTNLRWIYIALDKKTRMILHFHVGKRDANDAKKFLMGLSDRLNAKSKVSTDCLRSYITAVEENPTNTGELSPTRAIDLLRSKQVGRVLGRSITNKIEAHNGNVRQHVSRLARRTRCFSKKEEGLRQQLTLFFFYYNFIKIHKALKTTPAVALGITDEAFWVNKLMEYDLMFTGVTNNSDQRKTYGRVELPSKVVSIGAEEISAFENEMCGIVGTKRKVKKAKIVQLAV